MTTIREECESYLEHYKQQPPVYQYMVERYQALLDWCNSDELRTVYTIVGGDPELHGGIWHRRQDAQDWIDECLDHCVDCDCGRIEEMLMFGRDYGDMPIWEERY